MRDPLRVPPRESLDRLPKLNYSLLRENALRKKFAELSIPSLGSKSLLIRRHTEWVNLWNANCDSSRPRSKRDLLQDLDVWERGQGGHAAKQGGSLGGGVSVMSKDFDGAGWAANHGDDFKHLISSARATRGGSNGETHTMTVESSKSHDTSEVFLASDQLPSSGQNLHGPERSHMLDQSPPEFRNKSHEQYSSLSITHDDGNFILGSGNDAALLLGVMTEVPTQNLSR